MRCVCERGEIESNLAKNLKRRQKPPNRNDKYARYKANETRINSEGINNKLCYFEGIDF